MLIIANVPTPMRPAGSTSLLMAKHTLPSFQLELHVSPTAIRQDEPLRAENHGAFPASASQSVIVAHLSLRAKHGDIFQGLR